MRCGSARVFPEDMPVFMRSAADPNGIVDSSHCLVVGFEHAQHRLNPKLKKLYLRLGDGNHILDLFILNDSQLLFLCQEARSNLAKSRRRIVWEF